MCICTWVHTVCMCAHEHAYLCAYASVYWRQGLLSMLCGAGCLAWGFWESPIPASDDRHCHILLCMGSEDGNSSPCICVGSTFPIETASGPLNSCTISTVQGCHGVCSAPCRWAFRLHLPSSCCKNAAESHFHSHIS